MSILELHQPEPNCTGLHRKAPTLPIAITGIGLCTPLGSSASETWNALLAGQFIEDHARAKIAVPPGHSRVVELARRCAAEAAGGLANPLTGPETAIVVGTSKGPVEDWLIRQAASDPSRPPVPLSDLESPCSGLAEIAAVVGNELGITGQRLTVSAACASGLHALIRACMMIRSQEARRVLVIAAESSLHPLFLGSFRRLGVLPRPGVGCRPFDQSRDGFLMSEAAAAVVLQAAADSPDSHSWAHIDRYALGGDASHLTASDSAGRTLRRLLSVVSNTRPVDMVHAHGTGTVANDATELAAIEFILSHPTPVYSHKAALGHSLGAAGLISIVLNCMIHRHGILPPNIRTTNPIASHRATISSRAVQHPVSRSIALAAGFGGPTAVVSLTSPNP